MTAKTSLPICPTPCTSAFCGKVDCPPDCRHLPAMEKYRKAMSRDARAMTRLIDGVLPPNFPRQIRAAGRAWLFTGKVGTHHATGQASAEYGTDAIRYWRRADGTIEKD